MARCVTCARREVRNGSGVAMRQDVRSDSLKAFFNKHPSSSSWHAFGLALSLWLGRGDKGGHWDAPTDIRCPSEATPQLRELP